MKQSLLKQGGACPLQCLWRGALLAFLCLFALPTWAQSDQVDETKFITLTTAKQVGETITLGIVADEDAGIRIEGVSGTYRPDVCSGVTYRLSSQIIRIVGAVKQLSCGINKLTMLDVSHNEALQLLDCQNNQLSAIDLTKNVELQRLDCRGNQLISLDLTRNTSLWDLNCSGNRLERLDVSSLAQLSRFSCANNRLGVLDVSQIRNLYVLDCRGNQLSSLNVNSNFRLAELYCSDNNLTELHISHDYLKFLDCRNNQLTELNLMKCSSLVNLATYGNRLGQEAMSKIVNQLPSISIPQNKRKADGYFHAVNKKNANEGNSLGRSDANLAKSKGWQVRDNNNNQGANGEWDWRGIPYDGEDELIVKQKYVVTLEQSDGGKIRIKGKTAEELKAVEEGTELSVSIAREEGYTLTALTANGVDIMGTKKFVVTSDTRVVGTFEKRTFAVKLPEVEHATVRVKGNPDLSKVVYGTELELEITPDEEYVVEEVKVNGKTLTAPYRFRVDGEVTISIKMRKTNAVSEVGQVSIRLYPNPATSYIVVEGVEEGEPLRLINLVGRVVLEQAQSASGRLGVSHLDRGVYLLQVRGTTHRVVLR